MLTCPDHRLSACRKAAAVSLCSSLDSCPLCSPWPCCPVFQPHFLVPDQRARLLGEGGPQGLQDAVVGLISCYPQGPTCSSLKMPLQCPV